MLVLITGDVCCMFNLPHVAGKKLDTCLLNDTLGLLITSVASEKRIEALFSSQWGSGMSHTCAYISSWQVIATAAFMPSNIPRNY